MRVELGRQPIDRLVSVDGLEWRIRKHEGSGCYSTAVKVVRPDRRWVIVHHGFLTGGEAEGYTSRSLLPASVLERLEVVSDGSG